MDEKKLKKYIADWFGVEPDEDGEYDTSDYDWTAGCSFGYGGKWLSLGEVLECMKDALDNEGLLN